MRSLWNFIRVLAALAALAVAPVVIGWSFATEHYARYWFALGMPLFALVLIALWWLLFGWGPFGRRARHFGYFALTLIVLALAGRLLLRYDGSSSGTSLPRLVWRWQTVTAAGAKSIDLAPTEARPLADPTAEGVVDSPQFYGPNRDAIWPADQVVASFDWSKTKPEILWRQPIGLGWSGFSVQGRRAVTQEQRGGEEMVTCYDLLTGDLLWSHLDNTSFYARAEPGKEMAGDGPRSVPSIHQAHVFAFGATGILNCLRLETGEAVWQRDVLEDIGRKLPQWGKSTSPLVVEDLGLVVVSGAEKGPVLIAYETETGAQAWKADGNGSGYSSPRLVTLHGTRQIVSVNAQDVTGHDPATGAELWRFPWPGVNPKVCQPIDLPGDRLLITASYGVPSHLLQVTRDAGGKWSAQSVWRTLRLKTKFSSATVLGGHAYALDEGKLACVDLADGTRVWKAPADYGFGQHLQVGDRLLIQAEAGFLAVVAAKPDGFEELSRLDALNAMTWNPPTLAGRYLLVRNDREAICFKLPARE